MKKRTYVVFLGMFIGLVAFWQKTNRDVLDDNMSLAVLMENLEGKANPNRPDTSISGVSAEKGRELVFEGISHSSESILPPRRISKFFTCDACHNSQREESDLSNSSPEDRLQYAIDNDIPYLPGSTFWGIVNRENFYNDDYFKKYGQLVFPTRENLREAIQLCATECSQGRLLEDWELESILSYFWELELKVDDLDLELDERQLIDKALNNRQDKDLQKEAIAILKGKYPLKYPATFIPPPGTKEERVNVIGNPLLGEQIYRLSCQHCHYERNFSFFLLDDSKMTFKYLYKHIPDYDEKSLYQVIRYGTPPKSGKHAYMPQYTEEKMSRSQVIDLITYIKREAGKL